METLNRKKFDYTWVIVGCCFLMLMTSLGFCSSPKQLFLKAATEALDIKRSAYALNTTFRYGTMALLNMFFGKLVYRFKTRWLIAVGFLLLIASTLCYALAENVWLIYLGGIGLGLGLTLCGTPMASFVINSRCHKNKGTILGFVLAANGLGGALATQIVSPLIDSSVFGYRKAYFVVVLILAAVGVLVTVLFKDQKEPAEVQPKTKKARGQGWVGITFAEGKRKKYFIPTAIGLFMTGFVLSGINGISVSHMKDAGIDGDFVKNIWSFHSLFLMGSKFLVGFLYDRKGLRTCLLVCQITAVLVLIALAMVANTPFGIVMAVIYALFSSLALPLETIGVSLVVGDVFGNKEFAKFLGIMTALNSIGFAVGEPLMNLIYDVAGSYTLAIWIAVGVIAAVSIGFQFVITAAHKDRERILAEMK